MKLATEQEADLVLESTREWAQKHSMFRAATVIASVAAAEYILNQQGKTLYINLADLNDSVT